MSDYDTDLQNRCGTAAAPRLGTDAMGAVHYYDVGNDAVVVLAEDTIEHTEHLDGRPVTDWMDYVARERGWAINHLEESLGEWLADSIAVCEGVA